MERGCPEEAARGGGRSVAPGQREESGDRPPEGGEGCGAAAEPPQAPPGKLKKTALRLFGGKRSICTLPSFFGGRSKGQGKAASKKGLGKCRTHEGLSGAACERGDGAPLENPWEGSGDSPPCPLPSSRSAPSAVDAGAGSDLGRRDGSPPGGAEGCEKKASGEKSSLPRAKKGLKGFLNSIRRHRKSKAAESEPAELPEWSGDAEEAGKAAGAGAESRGAARGRGPGPVPAAVPAPGGSGGDGSAATACGEAAQPGRPAAGDGGSEGDVVAMPGEREGAGANSAAKAVACAEFAPENLLLAFPADLVDTDPPCLRSGDLLSLLLGDVTSLKSFDSLTGCGDDIAEPDMAESSISVERGRDAAKRSSCLVTYQGGGEEMAVPEEAEEFLPQIWEGGGDGGYGAQVSSSSLETQASREADAHPYVGEALDGVDLLTPQSDQQESAPNSDEGYYDSTTPGPEEEGGDGLGELKKDRLPRDSYSGDALYEFDTLLSPSLGEEPLFEGKVSRPGIFSYFLDFCLPSERSLVRALGEKRGLMETEEERLAAIQKELLFWELQGEPLPKRCDVPGQEKRPREKPCLECKSRAAGSSGKSASGLGSPPAGSPAPKRGVNGGGSAARAEKAAWGDFPGPLCPESRPKSHKAQGGGLLPPGKSHAGPDSEVEGGLLRGSVPGGTAPGRAGLFPGYGLPEPESGGGEEPLVGGEAEPEQAVSFSQALVEFAGSGTLFSSLSESLGSSGSGSSFTQNLPALPTMVTFDIVDVEQEGEGECERHPELNGGEDIAEAFEEGYGRKESLADRQESPGSPGGSFPSCPWGVASLPRRLRPHGPSPSMPAPLSVGRRSRSLDTESLESELAHSQVALGGGPQAGRPRWPREGGRRDSGGARRSRSEEEEEGEPAAPEGGWSRPGVRPLRPEAEAAAGGMKHWGFAPAAAAERAWEPPEQPVSPGPSLPLSVAGEPASRRPRELEPIRRPLRPCHLPLQGEGRRPRERPHGEAGGQKVPGWFPPGETEPEPPPGFRFACSPEKGAPCKPVGIAQGIPQHPPGSACPAGSPERCGEPLKGRASPGPALPLGCHSVAGKVTQGE